MIHKICLLGLLAVPSLSFANKNVTVDTLLDTKSSWDGKTINEWPKGQAEVKLLKYTIAPGTSLPWHRHPVPNVGHVLKGTLTVEVLDGPSKSFKAGDSFEEVINTWHRGVNKGTEAVEILVFQAAVVGQKVTELK